MADITAKTPIPTPAPIQTAPPSEPVRTDYIQQLAEARKAGDDERYWEIVKEHEAETQERVEQEREEPESREQPEAVQGDGADLEVIGASPSEDKLVVKNRVTGLMYKVDASPEQVKDIARFVQETDKSPATVVREQVAVWERDVLPTLPKSYQKAYKAGDTATLERLAVQYQQEYGKWASQFTSQELKEIQSGQYKIFDFDSGKFVNVSKSAYDERERDYQTTGYTQQELGEVISGKYTVVNPRTGESVAVTEAQMLNYQTAEQARESELAKARAETLPKPARTYTYRDPEAGARTVTATERKAILDEKGWNSPYLDRFTRDIPAVQDVVREALSFGQLGTMTFNRPGLAKQYEQQKEIALAVFAGDESRVKELYRAGAFGKDEKVSTWYYRDPQMGTISITSEERQKILADNPRASDLITSSRGLPTPPQAYKDALATIQQQRDVEAAVKAGDVTKLEQLYQEGAFGNDLATYLNLAKYVASGGRELSPITAQDIKDVSEGFGTQKEYVDAVLKLQPTTAGMTKDIVIAMVPVYGTVYHWNRMSTGEKVLSIATDILSLIPIVGGISAAAKTASGTGRGARIAAAMKVVPKLVVQEILSPLEPVMHPIRTVKSIGSTVKGLANYLDPRYIPNTTLSTVYSTVRLDTAILGDTDATMYVRDQLMALQAAGEKPVVQFGDKVFTLRSGTFLDDGGVVHASPNIRFAGEPEGFTVVSKVYPEGHPKAGLRMPDGEQGMFVANAALERFAVGGSAFGFEKGATSVADNIKAITDAAERAKSLGDVKKAKKLIQLVDNYDAALASKSIKALDKADIKILKKLAEMAEDEIISKINVARKVAGERYIIGDILGAQDAMAEALSYEKQLQKARPGFAVFAPEVNEILVPSGKSYTGMVFQPEVGEFWSIAMRELKSDKAAQLLQQAQDATRLGDSVTAAKLTGEAKDLIENNKSGFRRVETAEMELKFPELTQMQQLKPRYTTTASETGAKLWIYTTEPYSLEKALKAKLMAPIDTLRNIYDPAISVKTIPMTDTEKLAKIDDLLAQASMADKAGDITRSTLLRSEAGVIKRSMTTIKGVAKTDDIASAIARASKLDDADALMQSAKRAEFFGDYVSADRLREAADAIAGRRYVDAIALRAGTVSGLAEYTRALSAIRLGERGVPVSKDIPSRTIGLPERNLGEPIQAVSRLPDMLGTRTPEVSMLEIRDAGAEGVRQDAIAKQDAATRRDIVSRQDTISSRVGRTTDQARALPISRVSGGLTERRPETPGLVRGEAGRVIRPTDGRVDRVPADRRVSIISDTRLVRGDDKRTAQTSADQRIADTGRVPDTSRLSRGGDKMTDTTITRLQSQEVSIEDGRARLPVASVAWRQGMFWKWIPQDDFKDGAKPRTLPKGVEPIGAKFTDLRTPQETIQVIGDAGASVPDFRIDLGKTDIFITDRAQMIRYAGRGDQTDVGVRIPDNGQGMTVNGDGAVKGHAYARQVYPKSSVSRTDMDTEVQTPIREIRGADRTAITEQTKEIPVETEPVEFGITKSEVDTDDFTHEGLSELGAFGTFGDEDPNWLSPQKPVSRPRMKRARPRRGYDSPPPTVVRGMR